MSILDLFKQIESSSAGKPDWLIVGLGNPGLQYENTRHNAGFLTLDTVARQENTTIQRMKFKGLCGDANLGGQRCLLLKPTTYMNNSGESVVQAMQFYKIPAERMIIIYDDISLAPGKLRIRRKGSAGGHNGIKSIIELTGEDEFLRIKIGVGQKPHKDYNLADWVLSKFTESEMTQMQNAFEHAAECLSLMVQGKTDQAMNLHNA